MRGYDNWKLASPWDNVPECRCCDSEGKIDCPECDGSGYVWDDDDKEVICPVCRGDGGVDCPSCND